jgi:hypothetical protein
VRIRDYPAVAFAVEFSAGTFNRRSAHGKKIAAWFSPGRHLKDNPKTLV